MRMSSCFGSIWDLHPERDLIGVGGTAFDAHEVVKPFVPAICRNLNCFAPNLNVVRDPRWGRSSETYGEDPHLSGQMATAYVQGLQGDDPNYIKVQHPCSPVPTRDICFTRGIWLSACRCKQNNFSGMSCSRQQ